MSIDIIQENAIIDNKHYCDRRFSVMDAGDDANPKRRKSTVPI